MFELSPHEHEMSSLLINVSVDSMLLIIVINALYDYFLFPE